MKIAIVVLTALSLGGCYGLGLAGTILGSLQNSSGGQQAYYAPAPRPASYSCYVHDFETTCYPNPY